jgi:hypothetical protein
VKVLGDIVNGQVSEVSKIKKESRNDTHGNKNITIIPARGASKGLPGEVGQ